MSNAGNPPRISPAAALMFQGAIGAVGLAMVLLLDIPVQYQGVGAGVALAGGVAGGLATYGAIVALTRSSGLFGDSWASQMQKLHGFAWDYSWPVLMALAVLAGVGEELLFRGALQGLLAEHLHPGLAIVVASVVFGLVHWLSFTYFVLATGLGLVLGVIYAWTDSLVLVMVWHAVYDMIALYSLRRYPHLFGVHPPKRRPLE